MNPQADTLKAALVDSFKAARDYTPKTERERLAIAALVKKMNGGE